MKKVLSILSLLLVSAQAQQIKAIQFDGLVHISPEIAKEIIGIKVGQTLNESAVDNSIKRLYAQKYFKDIWVDENNGVLLYHVTEKPMNPEITLEESVRLYEDGLKNIKDAQKLIEEAKTKIMVIDQKNQTIQEGS